MEERKLTGLSKRRQISAASKAMFLWVALASIVVSSSAVAAQFIWNQFSFNNKLLAAKYKASDTLSKNKENVKTLKDNFSTLTADPNLAASRTQANPDEDNLQVILDALPTTPDTTALASSLQQIIVPAAGVSLQSVAVPADGTNGSTNQSDSTSTTQTTTSGPQTLDISLVVSGSYQSIQNFFKALEASIRPMDAISMSINGSDTNLQATVSIQTYYQPTTSVSITKKAVQ